MRHLTGDPRKQIALVFVVLVAVAVLGAVVEALGQWWIAP